MTTQPQTVINQDVKPEERQRLTAAEVSAQWRQNAGGGFGVAILAALAAYWLGAAPEQIGLAALTAGGVAFGLLMAFWSIVDEVMDWQAFQEMTADLDAAIADVEELSGELRAADLRVEELERENASLRYRLEHGGGRSNFVSADPEPTEPEGADVRKMIEVAYSSGAPVHPGKETMKKWGWTESQHAAAYAALRANGVIFGKANAPQWHATKEQALEILSRPRGGGVVAPLP